MLFAQSMKKYVWVASVDLSASPRTYSTPVMYRANSVPTYVSAGVANHGSRIDATEKIKLDKNYGRAIKEYDKVWVFDSQYETPTFDILASTATHVVRAIKDTPLVRTVEIRRLIAYDDGM